MKIFIDQGHNPGTVNGGASGNGLSEEQVNYQVGTYLVRFLQNDARFEVMSSRIASNQVLGTNTTTSLRERVDMANTWDADYFISIHCNSNPNPQINGSEVYVYSRPSTASNLARTVLDHIVSAVGTKDNQVRVNPSLYVLRATAMPAILIELAYLSNTKDALLLQSEQFLFAYAIYQSIVEFTTNTKQNP